MRLTLEQYQDEYGYILKWWESNKDECRLDFVKSLVEMVRTGNRDGGGKPPSDNQLLAFERVMNYRKFDIEKNLDDIRGKFSYINDNKYFLSDSDFNWVYKLRKFFMSKGYLTNKQLRTIDNIINVINSKKDIDF